MIFFINLPAGVVALYLFSRLPRSPRRVVPFDWAGQVAAVVGMGALTYGAIEAGAAGFGAPWVLVVLAVVLVALSAVVVNTVCKVWASCGTVVIRRLLQRYKVFHTLIVPKEPSYPCCRYAPFACTDQGRIGSHSALLRAMCDHRGCTRFLDPGLPGHRRLRRYTRTLRREQVGRLSETLLATSDQQQTSLTVRKPLKTFLS